LPWANARLVELGPITVFDTAWPRDNAGGAKLAYVDASSLCFMERHKIKIAWSTDHHLGLTGAEVLPRV
jgi:hypothetical protein